jgi:proline iminopeptidase
MNALAEDPLYPAVEPYEQGHLDVGDGHVMYFEQCGNPAGLPVVVLHGGPGSGCSPRQRRFFDAATYRIVLLDQRGCGRSTPRGGVSANTTTHLLADIERLRRHLGIARWLVFGGSWGSSLAIAYASTHASACLGLLLRGIFLTGRGDLDWFFRGSAQFLPEAWARFAPLAPKRHPLYHCARLFAGDDRAALLAAVRGWVEYEDAATRFGMATSTAPTATSMDDSDADDRLIDKYRIQAHYLVQRCFLGEQRLLDMAQRCRGLPTALLHGRRDIICRPDNAWRLHQALVKSQLRYVETAGHSPFDPAMASAIVAATRHFVSHGNFEDWS